MPLSHIARGAPSYRQFPRQFLPFASAETPPHYRRLSVLG
jgi:hypothetical protein